MKTFFLALFIHFAVVHAAEYQSTASTDCNGISGVSALGTYFTTLNGCKSACDSASECDGYQTYIAGLAWRCQRLTLADTFDISNCLSDDSLSLSLTFYQKIQASAAPPPAPDGNCFLYYRQAESLSSASGTGNQYCVMPGEEGTHLKCSDHYGFGTRHCECTQTGGSTALQTEICNRCDENFLEPCKFFVQQCYDQQCSDIQDVADHQKAAKDWAFTECLYAKNTCLTDSTSVTKLDAYHLGSDRKICPGHHNLVWSNDQKATIDGDDSDSCKDETDATDDGRVQSAWWVVPGTAPAGVQSPPPPAASSCKANLEPCVTVDDCCNGICASTYNGKRCEICAPMGETCRHVAYMGIVPFPSCCISGSNCVGMTMMTHGTCQ